MNEISNQGRKTNVVTIFVRIVLLIVIGFILIAILGGVSASTNMGQGMTGLIGIALIYLLWKLLKRINIGRKNN